MHFICMSSDVCCRFIQVVREHWASVPMDERDRSCIAVVCAINYCRYVIAGSLYIYTSTATMDSTAPAS